MADAYGKALGRGCLRSLFWQVVALVAGLVFVALFALLVAGSRFLPVEPWMQFAIAGALMLVLLFAFVAGSLGFAARRARVLDPAFARLGAGGSAIGVNGREYHGTARGRSLDAMYFRRGPLLQLHIETRVMTKLAVGTRTRAGEVLREMLGLSELALDDPALASLIASSIDPGFARALLHDARVKPLLLELLIDPAGNEMRVVALRPGVISLTRRYFDPDALSPEQLARSVDLLVGLAELAEGARPPAVTAEASALERSFRRNPGRLGFLVVGLVLGLALIVALAVAAMAFLPESSPSRGRPRSAPARSR